MAVGTMNAIEMPWANFCGASNRNTIPGVSTWPPPIPSSPLRNPATKPSSPSPPVVSGFWAKRSTGWALVAAPPGISRRIATNSRKMPNMRRRFSADTLAVARAPSVAPITAVTENSATSTMSIWPLSAYGTALTSAVGMITKSDVPVALCWLMPRISTMPGTRIAAPPMPSRPLSRPVRTPMIAIARQWARTSSSNAAALAIRQRRQPLAQGSVHQPARPAPAQHAHHLVERLRPVQLDRLARVHRDVRRHDHVVHLEQRVVRVDRLVLENVESGAGQLAGPQRLDQRRLVDDRPAAGIDEVGGRLHQRELRSRDHVARLVVQEDVQRHVVALAQELLERHQLGAVLP